MLAELEIEYETRGILPRTEGMDDPVFKQLNQRGKVPVFQQGDMVIGESGAIVFYLADRYRDRCSLAPERGTTERAIFDDLCLFSLMELDGPLYVIRRHGGLPDVYGESEVAVRAAGEYFLRQIEVMDRRLSDGRPFLLGESFSAADLLLATCLAWGQIVKLTLTPCLEDFLARISTREPFKRAAAVNFPPAVTRLIGGAGTVGSED